MPAARLVDVSYFPGCSLATTARENNQSLIEACGRMGINLIEITGWNCCGSSSAHSVRRELAFGLAARNLSLAPSGRPLVVACPNCMQRLKHAQQRLRNDEVAREKYRHLWGCAFDPGLSIQHVFGLLGDSNFERILRASGRAPIELRFAPYYGCMLKLPLQSGGDPSYYGIMEKTLGAAGMQPVNWASAYRCCGTFLTAARPDIVTPKVNAIIQGAAEASAECIVTACAMCHMNLEVRCSVKHPVPIFHFSEIVALAFGIGGGRGWFSRHLIDPRPLLASKGLI
jgi:heterodisulfide reductase subunit B